MITLEMIHEKLCLARLEDAAKMIEEYGPLNFFSDYKEFLERAKFFDDRTRFNYFSTATITYFIYRKR